MNHNDERDYVFGQKRRAAYGLALLGPGPVHRATVRAMLPVGVPRDASARRHAYLISRNRGNGRRNNVSLHFQQALAEFECQGWIIRGAEFVLVRNVRALLDLATERLSLATLAAGHVVSLEAAAIEVRRALQEDEIAPRARQLREHELAVIRSLMVGPVGGSRWSGRGAVRFIPRGGRL